MGNINPGSTTHITIIAVLYLLRNCRKDLRLNGRKDNVCKRKYFSCTNATSANICIAVLLDNYPVG